MTRITFQPEGADPQTWSYQWSKLLSPECIAMEQATGMDYATELVPALVRGNMTALTALLWIHLRRDQPDLRFDQVQFCLDDLKLEDDDPVEAPVKGKGKDQSGEAPRR
jgi:hypothetical protein